MNILEKIDNYLNEKVRGFKTAKEIADFVMKMKSKVKEKDKAKFDAQLVKSLKKADPDGKMDPHEVISKMNFKDAKSVYAILTGFSYDGLDD